MKIFIDADGCPVVKSTIEIANKRNIEVIIICDTSHIFDYKNIETIIVSKGVDSVDFVLVNKVSKNDIVITQDYGLAAMCLAKGAIPINQNGYVYNNENIDVLLYTRHLCKKVRRSGSRFSKVKKRTKHNDEKFINCLLNVINSVIT